MFRIEPYNEITLKPSGISALQFGQIHTAGRGGATGVVNRASIAAVGIERIE